VTTVRVHAGSASEFGLVLLAGVIASKLYGWTPEADRPALEECVDLEAAIKVLRFGGARRVMDELEVHPDDVKAMLAKAGIRSAPDQDALDDIAHECTFRAIELRILEVCSNPKFRPLERQASEAVSTLRRVLPRMIEVAPTDHPRVVEYRALLAALSPSFDFSRGRKYTWHTAARALAGLYTLHVNPAAGWSHHGAGAKFLQLALDRISRGRLNIEATAIEKALDPKRYPEPDPGLAGWPYTSFPGLFDRVPPRARRRRKRRTARQTFS